MRRYGARANDEDHVPEQCSVEVIYPNLQCFLCPDLLPFLRLPCHEEADPWPDIIAVVLSNREHTKCVTHIFYRRDSHTYTNSIIISNLRSTCYYSFQLIGCNIVSKRLTRKTVGMYNPGMLIVLMHHVRTHLAAERRSGFLLLALEATRSM